MSPKISEEAFNEIRTVEVTDVIKPPVLDIAINKFPQNIQDFQPYSILVSNKIIPIYILSKFLLSLSNSRFPKLLMETEDFVTRKAPIAGLRWIMCSLSNDSITTGNYHVDDCLYSLTN